jgi:hypothetical protein
MTVIERMLFDKLDQIERLLKAALPPLPDLPLNENDYVRNKRIALERHAKNQQRTEQRRINGRAGHDGLQKSM